MKPIVLDSHADTDKMVYIKKSTLRNYVIVLINVCLLSCLAGYSVCTWQYRDAETIANVSAGLLDAFAAQKAYSDSLSDLRASMTVLSGTVKAQSNTMMRHIAPKAYQRKSLP